MFSLAAVAYELLTTRAPFPGKSITEVISRVVHGSHVPPREVDPRLPENLNAVFARAFAPRPEARYVLAMDMSRDLHAALQAAGTTTPVHLIGGADVAAELDPKRAIAQGSHLAAGF